MKQFLLGISVPFYIWDWIDYLIIEDRSIWIYISLISLTMAYFLEILSVNQSEL